MVPARPQARRRLPLPVQWDVHELVVLELIEGRDVHAARQVLELSPTFALLKADDPDRYGRLERLTRVATGNGGGYGLTTDLRNLYGPGNTRDKRRSQVAHLLSQYVSVAPPQRLMRLVGDALRWQRRDGALTAPGAKYDLFTGQTKAVADAQDVSVHDLEMEIKVGSKKAYPEVVRVSPDGSMFATGSVDGFVEIYDARTGKLKNDLPYQAQELFMMHDTAVLAMSWSRDGEWLTTASQDGEIRVWKVDVGKCLKKFVKAHHEGITSVTFSRDKSQVLSASFDGTAKVHGLRSGKMLKEFRGHTSYVNAAIYDEEGGKVS